MNFNHLIKTYVFFKAFCKLGPVCPEGYVWLPPTRACVSLKKTSTNVSSVLRDLHSGMI